MKSRRNTIRYYISTYIPNTRTRIELTDDAPFPPRYALYCLTLGVYLGNHLNEGDWSHTADPSQRTATTFASREELERITASWPARQSPCRAIRVHASVAGIFATAADLKRVGVDW